MHATEILKDEHRVIERVLLCLEKIGARAQQTGKLDESSARLALDFFVHFCDGCHHAKEERHLFPLLERKGLARANGPTGVMLREHEDGRKHLQAMTRALPAATAGAKEALQRFAFHAQAFASLLRQHILKEDYRLFPMADELLTADEKEALARAFIHVEHEDAGAGTHQKYLDIAHELCARFEVADDAGAGCLHGCACRHVLVSP